MFHLLFQSADTQSDNEVENVQIKEESAEDDVWKNDQEDQQGERNTLVSIRYKHICSY